MFKLYYTRHLHTKKDYVLNVENHFLNKNSVWLHNRGYCLDIYKSDLFNNKQDTTEQPLIDFFERAHNETPSF